MSAVWLLLFLGGLVHLLVLNGFGLKHPASFFVLLPVLAGILLPPLVRKHPRLLPTGLLRGAGLVGFACTLGFVKSIYMEGWDTQNTGLNLALAGAGLGSLLPTLAASGTPMAGTWVWIAAWLGTGLLDPALPLLGAGLAGMLQGSGFGIEGPPQPEAPRTVFPGWPLFLFGFACSKPWWDFGIESGWAWASASVGLGAAVAVLPRLGPRLDRLPSFAPVCLFGALAILYVPGLGPVWGALLGLALGALWRRFPTPFPLAPATAAFLLGLLTSFTLHANLWIPGLRHLLWLGN